MKNHEGEQKEYTLCSWNIWGGRYYDAIYAYIARSCSDIIALQEVEEDGRGGNTAMRLSEALGYQCVYGRSFPYPVGERTVYRGNAVLSRMPISKHRVIPLSQDQSRTALLADIRTPDGTVHVVSAHIVHSHQQPSKLQEDQVRTLISALPGPRTVIMGDFNSLPDSGTILLMRKKYRDADPGSVPTWCLYPDGCQQCKIESVRWKLDYIFTTADVGAADFVAGTSNGSDHLPVHAVIRVA